MFYCNDCKQFSLSKWDYEKQTNVCGYCDSENIQDAGKCEVCGSPTPRSIDDYCEECTALANKQINFLAGALEIDRKIVIDLFSAIIEREN